MKSSCTDSLAHTTWECKYHIVFTPKFRRKVICGKLRQEIGMMLRELCRRKDVKIINTEACLDHIHITIKEYKEPFKGMLMSIRKCTKF